MDDLARALAGRLLLPADADYARASSPSSPCTTNAARRRSRCANPPPTSSAAWNSPPRKDSVAARSGGHSYAGYSTPDGGLVIDVSRLDTVEVRPDGTTVVGGGARLAGVFEAVGRAGRMLSGGTCPTVGVAGLTLGGGIGALAKVRPGSDQLLAATIVTADGVLRTVSDDDELSGRSEEVAAATSVWSPRSRSARSRPSAHGVVAGLHHVQAALLDGWQTWQADVPEEMWSQVRLGTPEGIAQVAAASSARTPATSTSWPPHRARRANACAKLDFLAPCGISPAARGAGRLHVGVPHAHRSDGSQAMAERSRADANVLPNRTVSAVRSPAARARSRTGTRSPASR